LPKKRRGSRRTSPDSTQRNIREAATASLRATYFTFAVICAAALLLQSCATQPPPEVFNPPGFLSGLLHGTDSVRLIASLFTDYRIYAFPTRAVGTTSVFFSDDGVSAAAGRAPSGDRRRAREFVKRFAELNLPKPEDSCRPTRSVYGT
jgi:hypothetical protein